MKINYNGYTYTIECNVTDRMQGKYDLTIVNDETNDFHDLEEFPEHIQDLVNTHIQTNISNDFHGK